MGKAILSLLIVLGLSFASTSASVVREHGNLGQSTGGSHDARDLSGRADPSLAGYLGAFFLGSDPYVYFYLSNGNNALSFKALNRGSPVMKPTKGTKGVRDPALVAGGGAEAGKKWYIVGTDLDIGKVWMH